MLSAVDEDLTVSEFGLDMVAMDDDVLSLCLDSAFADVEVQRDSTALFLLAQALAKLQVNKTGRPGLAMHISFTCSTQKTFGHIPRIHAKGAHSRQVVHMMAVARRQADAGSARPEPGASDGPSSLARSGPSAPSGDAPAFSSPGGGVATLTVHDLDGDNGRSEIDIAVLLDRSVDLVSPLFTPVRKGDEPRATDCPPRLPLLLPARV